MTVLNLGCGKDQPQYMLNVDINEAVDPDIVKDITDTPWEFLEYGECERIVATHVVEHLEDLVQFMEECARVLQVGGTLEITTPLGINSLTDNDHEHYWTYETPETYSMHHNRSWDPGLPFSLLDREVEVWLGGPLSPLTPFFQLLSSVFPKWASYRCFAGELTSIFERVEQ